MKSMAEQNRCTQVSGFSEGSRAAQYSHRRYLFSQIPDTSSTPEALYLKTDSDRQVYTLCQQLKSPYKEVAVSHFCKQLTVTEIARQTQKNPKPSRHSFTGQGQC